MSSSKAKSEAKPQTKKFQKGERTIPTDSDKALKYYPAEDEAVNKKPRKSQRPYKARESLQPGRVLILLAGRFRGKRVVLLKVLDQGVLLVTGPFKINGVPLRRVNARYVIATKTDVKIKDFDQATIDKAGDAKYFERNKKDDKKGSEEKFFGEGKKEKNETSKNRVDDQKKVDKSVLAAIKKDSMMAAYLGSNFALRKGDRPHEMVF